MSFIFIKHTFHNQQRLIICCLFLKVLPATFLLVCFVYLKESTFETMKNAFYFTSKALLVLEIIKF